MSHTMGVLCQVCEEVLIDSPCPEGDGPHGYTFQEPGPWAREHWPEHACFN